MQQAVIARPVRLTIYLLVKDRAVVCNSIGTRDWCGSQKVESVPGCYPPKDEHRVQRPNRTECCNVTHSLVTDSRSQWCVSSYRMKSLNSQGRLAGNPFINFVHQGTLSCYVLNLSSRVSRICLCHGFSTAYCLLLALWYLRVGKIGTKSPVGPLPIRVRKPSQRLRYLTFGITTPPINPLISCKLLPSCLY